MKPHEILSLPTEAIEKMSDDELLRFLGPLLPEVWTVDKENAAKRDLKQALDLGSKLMAQMQALK